MAIPPNQNSYIFMAHKLLFHLLLLLVSGSGSKALVCRDSYPLLPVSGSGGKALVYRDSYPYSLFREVVVKPWFVGILTLTPCFGE